MAEILDFKVSYVRITGEGLDRVKDVNLSSITSGDKQDVKSLIFFIEISFFHKYLEKGCFLRPRIL